MARSIDQYMEPRIHLTGVASPKFCPHGYFTGTLIKFVIPKFRDDDERGPGMGGHFGHFHFDKGGPGGGGGFGLVA